MQSNFSPALSRGISDFLLYEYDVKHDYKADMFHMESMDGAYDDEVQMEGMGLPQEHFPMQKVGFDGIRPSYTVRYLARTWTLGTVIAYEDKADDLYNIINRFFPMVGGEFGRSFYTLEQILAAQFFGLYGFQTGTSVPFSPDGLSYFNTAHPYSLQNQGQTYSNTSANPTDLSIASTQLAASLLKTQKRPNGIGVLENRLKKLVCHTNLEWVARQILNYTMERGTNDNNRNYLSDLDVQLVLNPYFEYSGTAGALTSPQAFNSHFFMGETHFCKWKERSDLESFSRFDNTVLADVIVFVKRFAFGLSDARGIAGFKGL